jgi:putative hemolysin
MLGNLLFEFVIIIALIIANGFFAASEIAIVSARKGRLEQQVRLGRGGAQTALQLAENPNRFLSTVQVGITLISTFAAAFGGANLARIFEAWLGSVPALAPYASSIALAIVVLAISYLSLILGELTPKRLALQNTEVIAAAVAPAMYMLSRLASPIVGFLSFSTDLVLRLLGRHNVPEVPVTEEDIMALVREGTEEGTVDAAEQALISSVFTFTDRTVRSLMTPRTQIVAIEADTPLPDVLLTIRDSGYSRIPVYQETLDQIIGILFVKDLLHSWGQPDGVELRPLLRLPLYVLEHQRASMAFQQLKQQRSMLGIVLDEYGQVAGLISIEDMLEALVGAIDDEYDDASESVVRREDGSYLVDGLLPFADLQTRLDLPPLDQEQRAYDFETIAGFLLASMGRIPSAGDTLRWHDYTFEIMDMDGQRIDKILIYTPQMAERGGAPATSTMNDERE